MGSKLNYVNLKSHLNPTGNLYDSDSIPDVIDNTGNIVTLVSDRITNSTTVVDVGDSPNSNTGDPLRLAFVKINNFIEASYWTSAAIDSELQDAAKFIAAPYFPSAAPSTPVVGSVWFEVSTSKLYVYNGTTWKSVTLS